jgi:SAM-dependent methyltransferase
MAKLNAFGRQIPSLGECVEAPQLRGLLLSQLLKLFSGQSDGGAQQLAHLLFQTVASAATDENAAVAAQQLLAGTGVRKRLREGLSDRSVRILRQIQEHVVGPKVLDYGCGDGEVGRLLYECSSEYQVTLTDVMDYRAEAARVLPWRDLVDSKERARLTGDIDSALLLTVLHHCEDPGASLRHILSLRPRRIVTIESVYGLSRDDVRGEAWKSPDADLWITLSHADQFRYACFWDWFYNKVVNSGVIVPYNFLSPSGWSFRISALGYHEVMCTYLGIDQPLVPEFHVLQVFEAETP